MKQKLLYLMILFLSLSNAYGVCTNPKLTRPIIIDTFCTLTTCCSDLKDTLTNLSVNVTDPCAPTPITTSTSITTPGSYCLANSFVGTVTIGADFVTLDLNGHTITASGLNAITVDNAPPHECIVIRNGCVRDATREGVYVTPGNSKVILQDLIVINCGNSTNPYGIRFDDCRSCLAERCIVADSRSGISLESTFDTVLRDCQALNITGPTGVDATGFLFDADRDTAINCIVSQLSTSTNATTRGFDGQGDNLIFKNCSARSLSGGGTNIGFDIQEDRCLVVDCLASSITTNTVIGFFVPSRTGDFDNRNCLKNCVAQCLEGDDVAGYRVGGPCILNECKALDLFATVTARGFDLDTLTGPEPSNVIMNSCKVLNIFGTVGKGFDLDSTAGDNLVTNCIANNCSTICFDISNAADSAVWCIGSNDLAPSYTVISPPSGTVVAPGGAITTGVNIAIPTPP